MSKIFIILFFLKARKKAYYVGFFLLTVARIKKCSQGVTHNIGSKQDSMWLKCYNITVERKSFVKALMVIIMRKITMKEALKSKGWKLNQMADLLCCSISQVSKIKNGNVLISKEFQEKFQSKFPDCELVNDKLDWKEKYVDLKEEFILLREDAVAMQKELNDYKRIFASIGEQLLGIGNVFELNAKNVNDYRIEDTYRDLSDKRKKPSIS